MIEKSDKLTEKFQVELDLKTVRFQWAPPTRAAQEYVNFFCANTDTSFISFGEIIDGRAVSPEEWSPKLRDVLTSELSVALAGKTADREQSRVFEARSPSDSLLGYVLVSIDKAAATPNAWLDDVVIASEIRSKGLGSMLVAAVEKAIGDDHSVFEIYLESSRRKPRAHRFFEQLGFQEVAIVMRKALKAR